jgi:molybdopterin-guanine dinucleotide biosynthesis protein A
MTNTVNTENLPLPLTALILCGGKSRRMGRPKAFLPYDGTTMVAHIINTAKEIFSEVFLVANEPPFFEDLGVDIVKDILPYRGPLGGILSGLLVASYQYSFVLACDMPFIDKKLILEMLKSQQNSDVLILAHENGIEPLIGLYSKSCIKPMEESLFAGEPTLHDFVSGLNAKTFFCPEQKQRTGKDMPPYFNIDTPQDYTRAVTRSFNNATQFGRPK